MFSSHQIKKLLTNTETSRSSISAKKNIHSNFQSLKQTFAELDSGLKAQSVYIKELDFTNKGSESQEKHALLKMIDIAHGEMVEWIKVGKEVFAIGIKDKKNTWEKVLIDLNKKIEGLKGSIGDNVFDTVSKLLNLKDSIVKQFFKAMIYRKNLLWQDLKMPYQPYVHHQIQSILDIIKVSNQKYGYTPTKLQFSTLSLDGRWSDENPESVTDLFRLCIQDFNEMVETIKNYGELNDSPQSFQDVNKNQQIVKGLREKIEHHSINYNLLLEKYRTVQSKDSDNQLKLKIDQLTLKCNKKDSEISLLQNNITIHETSAVAMRERIKEMEDQLLKLNVNYYPKVKEVEGLQKGLLEQFFKVKKQIDVVSASLENDNQLKNRLQNDLKGEKAMVEKLVDILGRERRNIKDLKEENKKLDKLVSELVNKQF